MKSMNGQSLRNKRPLARKSAYIMALRNKHKKAGAHKPAPKQPHARVGKMPC